MNGTGNYRGGLVGYANVSVTACYYDRETSVMDDVDGASANPAYTTAMKTQGTYTGWDFSTVWDIDTLNNGYPYLTNNAPAE